MRTAGRRLVWFVLVVACCAGFIRADDVEELTARVQWDGRQYGSDRLPERLPATARRAIAEWTPWCALRGYRMDLTDDARVLLLSPRRAKGTRSRVRLCEKTLESFDAFVPAPPRGKSVRLQLASLAPEPAGERATAPRGNARLLDRETVVLLSVPSQRELDALHEELSERYPRLAPDLAIPDDARTGLVVLDPLIGAWDDERSERASDPDNELVHRLSLLLLRRRFGRQPHWVRRGFAWRMEQDLLGDVQCFRDEDRGLDLGEDWFDELEIAARATDGPFDLTALAAWREGTSALEQGARAFGVMSYLFAEHPEVLSRFLEDLRVFRSESDEHGEVSGDVQRELLEIYLHRDVLDELSQYLARGKTRRKIRPPRAKR